MKHLKILTILILSGLFYSLSSCQTDRNNVLELIRSGKSEYTIYLPAEANQTARRAAQMLQEHLFQSTECLLPISQQVPADSSNGIFLLEDPQAVNGDAFRVEVLPDRLSIYGGNKKGIVYGVVSLLENQVGVRYLHPDFVHIPTHKNVSINHGVYSDYSTNTHRNVNYQFSLDSNYRDFNRLHTKHDLFAEGFFVHTFHRLVPWQEYFKSNPEYFALMNGKRLIDQLCPSNPEVLNLIHKRLKHEMLLQPDKEVWSVSQDDNFSYCQCPSCQAIIDQEESPAGPILHLVNALADSFPDKTISTLAYQYSRKAPRHIKPRENVQIMLCTIELNRSEAIVDDPRSAAFVNDLKNWANISNRIFLWDYTVDFAHQISPFPNLHVLQKNIQLFTQHGANEHFQQTNTGNGHEFSELKAYLLSKLLWNPDANVSALIHEFTDLYYGAAAPYIRTYIDHLEQEIKLTGEWLDIYGPPTNYQETFLSADNLAAYKTYFDKAEAAVRNDSAFLLHVKTARMPIQYAEMEIGKNDLFGDRGWYREVDGAFLLRENMRATLEDFYQTGLACNAYTLNESGLMVDDYYQSTLRFIDVQVDNNHAFRKPVSSEPLPAAKYSQGNLQVLSNGVRGANDFKVHWLGWEAVDAMIIMDLEEPKSLTKIEISSLYDPKSWILHPKSVQCRYSADRITYRELATLVTQGDQRKEPITKLYTFTPPSNDSIRFIQFQITGTKKLPDWHPSAGYGSWFFIDEIIAE